jgi:predicted hotdog family 3-hydroxylacyl-ACP dehydratase
VKICVFCGKKKNKMKEENILALIPQQPPFVMIDKLYHSDESITRTGFHIAVENVLTINGVFTEAGLLENMAQTAAARAGYTARLENKPVRLGYIGAVKNLEIFSLPQVNDQLVTEIKIEDHLFDVTMISGRVWCNEKLIAQCEMKIFLA